MTASMIRYLRTSRLLQVLVILNFVSIIYFGLIASDVYKSSSSIIVRNGEGNRSTMTSLLSGATGNGTEFGGYVFTDFVKSWDEFNRLRGPLDLDHHFRDGDFVSRFGGLATLWSSSETTLWHYYKDSIDIEVDTKSGIVSMIVTGYDPKFSHDMAQKLLADAVIHLTRMNSEREDQMVRSSRDRFAELSRQLEDQDAALAAYRSRVGIFEPTQVYQSQLELINQLIIKETDLKAQLGGALRETPNSPAVHDLRQTLSETTSRIAEERSNIIHTSQQAASYDNMKVARDSTVELIKQASEAQQEARREAVDNAYYLNVISEPSRPQDAELPHRLRWIMVVLAASVIIWGILR